MSATRRRRPSVDDEAHSDAADAAAADFAAGRLAVGPDGLDEYRVTDLGFGCGHHHGDHGCGGEHGCGAH